MNPINKTKAKFINIRKSDSGEKKLCLSRGWLTINFYEVPHENGSDWNEIYRIYLAKNKPAKKFANEVTTFYDEPETTIWFTFTKDRALWWCQAKKGVTMLTDSQRKNDFNDNMTRYRETVDGWHRVDNPENYPALLTIKGYRCTIRDISLNNPKTTSAYTQLMDIVNN